MSHCPVPPSLASIAVQFDIPGRFVSASPCGNGHINDTYAAVYEGNGQPRCYIHQRINTHVFRDPVALMENIERVTRRQRETLLAAGEGDIERRALTLVPAHDGGVLCRDDDGHFWRTCLYIEGSQACDTAQNAAQAREGARAFGAFQAQLAGLPAPRLHETIPHFHDTPRRLSALEAALESDPLNRAREARREIEAVARRADWTGRLLEQQAQGVLPERITHNDAKLNNVLLDAATQRGLCVIDLDTVMPGLALYDFGDLVRSAASPCAEDEADLSQVNLQLPLFQALVDGYLDAAHQFLTPGERKQLAFCGKLMTLEVAIRFLTDFLQGDTYFKTKHPKQNLARCRTQLRMVESMEEQEEAMEEIVQKWTPGE